MANVLCVFPSHTERNMEGLTLNVYLFVLAAAETAGNLKWNFIPTRENNNPAGIESHFFVFL